jgi:3-hydroxyacyl-CoA dehydrogenase
LYKKSAAKLITTGNYQDDFSKISDCDWIIEVVIEIFDIKKQILDQVEKYRKLGSIVTSNTSGIPITSMAEGRSEDFKKHFAGTHFFNPPRYLRLLEIIPTKYTDPEITNFLMHYGDLFLGKQTVLCKDTPAFIANRIGIYAIMHLLHLVDKMGLTVSEVDKVTGPLVGRPKSATFRTLDVVGLDTAVKVAKGIADNCPHDECKEVFQLPHYVQKMIENQQFGDKTGKGFYFKDRASGSKEILELNLQTGEYQAQQKVKASSLDALKNLDSPLARIKSLAQSQDKFGEFTRQSMYGVFAYVSNRIPEISDELYKIDDALKAGFGWEFGPFVTWDYLGVKETLEACEKSGYKVAQWVHDMVSAGNSSFYKIEKGIKKYYDIPTKSYLPVPGLDKLINLDSLRPTNVIWKNEGSTIHNLGDEILCVEFHTKMNSLGGEVLQGINKAIELAEASYKGLVIGNQGENFSAGANLGMVFMMACQQEWDELNFAIKYFQDTIMRVRYSSIPVVVAPHGLTLGGACEMSMHADAVQAAAETYIGLVEVGVGLIPAGCGTKEFSLRISDQLRDGEELNILRDYFLTIGQAKVATSAEEAYELGYFRKGFDRYSVNIERRLTDAKRICMELYEKGYTQPVQRNDIKVLGRAGLAVVHAGVYSMNVGGYISEHDKLIATKLGYVLCGGDLSAKTEVSEQYLLDLEREAFLSLCGEQKTLERINSILTSGKPLRN